jgi:ParB family chromosome partitioning protein
MAKRIKLSNLIATKELSFDNTDSRETASLSIPAVRLGDEIKKVESTRAIEYLVDTKLCEPWRLHDRDPTIFTTENCSDLIESIKKMNNKFPLLQGKVKTETKLTK